MLYVERYFDSLEAQPSASATSLKLFAWESKGRSVSGVMFAGWRDRSTWLLPPGTVSVADPFTPPLLAVTTVEPGPTAVATPFASMLATKGCEVVHEIARPLSVWPLGSRTVAENLVVEPRFTVTDPGVTVTVPVGIVRTVTVANEVALPLCALMLAMPTDLPVTRPVESTVATAWFPLDHATLAPGIVVPDESRTTAMIFIADPSVTSSELGVSVIDAGEGG
jgi:hypothetical protein